MRRFPVCSIRTFEIVEISKIEMKNQFDEDVDNNDNSNNGTKKKLSSVMTNRLIERRFLTLKSLLSLITFKCRRWSCDLFRFFFCLFVVK